MAHLNSSPYCPIKFEQFGFTIRWCYLKTAYWVPNCANPDQMPRSVACDLTQHHFLRPVCRNIYEPAHDKTYNKTVPPAMTWISLRRSDSIWSDFAYCMCLRQLRAIQRGINKNPCHTGWMYSLIWAFANHTGLTVVKRVLAHIVNTIYRCKLSTKCFHYTGLEA